MAKYTVELKTLMNDEHIRPLLDKSLSTYPMYQPSSDDPEVIAIIPTREQLNAKILNHFKYREIGFETVGRFLDELEIAMCEIMPYYNQMYKSCEIMALIDDPFGNVDVTETFSEKRTAEGSSSGTEKSTVATENNSHNKTVTTETPQGKITTPAKDINTIDHADSVSWMSGQNNDNSTSNGESAGTSKSDETTEHTFTKKGNQGVNTYAHDMIEFRTSIIDVTKMILDDSALKNLFMQVY